MNLILFDELKRLKLANSIKLYINSSMCLPIIKSLNIKSSRKLKIINNSTTRLWIKIYFFSEFNMHII